MIKAQSILFCCRFLFLHRHSLSKYTPFDIYGYLGGWRMHIATTCTSPPDLQESVQSRKAGLLLWRMTTKKNHNRIPPRTMEEKDVLFHLLLKEEDFFFFFFFKVEEIMVSATTQPEKSEGWQIQSFWRGMANSVFSSTTLSQRHWITLATLWDN